LKSVRVSCPAKVNLHLSVLARRPDGYHEIVSLMQTVGLHDEINLEIDGEGIQLDCDLPDLSTGDENLARRAAHLFQEETGTHFGLKMHLQKRIPVAAGLGGGSSDAAGVLRALNRLQDKGVSRERLFQIAARLGADVPFFLMGGAAAASGIGEQLRPVNILPTLYHILVSPGFPVSTKWVYENLDWGLTRPRKQIRIPALFEREEEIFELLQNDLERVTAAAHPWISRTKARLIELGAKGALMSGSGPTVFGIFTEEDGARCALRDFQTGPGESVWFARGESSLPAIQEAHQEVVRE
jgi:4-diphosphocytidyl-2-C-methyl-D-erythritol kinase